MNRPLRANGEFFRLDTPSPPLEEKKFIGYALSNDEINQYTSNISNFLGAKTFEELEKIKIPQETFGVIIFIPHGVGQIGHWVALVCDFDLYYEIDFYDSFGRSPKELKIKPQLEAFVARVLKEINPKFLLKYKVNRMVQQNANESSCGSFCLNFVIDRLVNKKSFKEATHYNNHYCNIQEREKTVKKYTKAFPLI